MPLLYFLKKPPCDSLVLCISLLLQLLCLSMIRFQFNLLAFEQSFLLHIFSHARIDQKLIHLYLFFEFHVLLFYHLHYHLFNFDKRNKTFLLYIQIYWVIEYLRSALSLRPRIRPFLVTFFFFVVKIQNFFCLQVHL